MANANALQHQTGRLFGINLGDWEVTVTRRPEAASGPLAAAAHGAEVTFDTGVRWAIGGLLVGLALLAAAASGLTL